MTHAATVDADRSEGALDFAVNAERHDSLGVTVHGIDEAIGGLLAERHFGITDEDLCVRFRRIEAFQAQVLNVEPFGVTIRYAVRPIALAITAKAQRVPGLSG